MRLDVAIFHDIQSSTAAPPQWSAFSTRGFWRTMLPSPSGTRNIIRPMPTMTPSRHGSPLSTPAFAPAAVSMMLLGPGVIAATRVKRRNATARSVVVLYLQAYGHREHQIGRRGGPSRPREAVSAAGRERAGLGEREAVASRRGGVSYLAGITLGR